MYEFELPKSWNDAPLSIKLDEIVDPGRKISCSFTATFAGGITRTLADIVTNNVNGLPLLLVSPYGAYGAMDKIKIRNQYPGDYRFIVTSAAPASPNEITIYVEAYKI
jgi:hypothetical protein